MSNPAALKTLEDARWYLLDPAKWLRNSYQVGDKVCLMQALSNANGAGESDAKTAVLGVVKKRGYTSIPSFNDATFTTYAEIIRALDEAIASVK